jgi:3-methyladenine DNA glycosylase AlkC
MNEQEFNAKLGEMIEQIGGLSPEKREHLTKLAEETKDRHARMKKTVHELQDSLDYLRLSIKYVLFDLEATRRENQYLRKLLEKQANPDAGEDRPE